MKIRKHIQESALLKTNGKHVSIHLKDEAVTNSKLAPGSISWGKLDANLQNIISSGGGGGGAVLVSEFGDSEEIGITQKALTESRDNLQEQIDHIDGNSIKPDKFVDFVDFPLIWIVDDEGLVSCNLIDGNVTELLKKIVGEPAGIKEFQRGQFMESHLLRIDGKELRIQSFAATSENSAEVRAVTDDLYLFTGTMEVETDPESGDSWIEMHDATYTKIPDNRVFEIPTIDFTLPVEVKTALSSTELQGMLDNDAIDQLKDTGVISIMGRYYLILKAEKVSTNTARLSFWGMQVWGSVDIVAGNDGITLYNSSLNYPYGKAIIDVDTNTFSEGSDYDMTINGLKIDIAGSGILNYNHMFINILQSGGGVVRSGLGIAPITSAGWSEPGFVIKFHYQGVGTIMAVFEGYQLIVYHIIPDASQPDLSNYYTKSETYSRTEVDSRIPSLTNYYTKNETYSKSEVYNKTETYTKAEVNTLLPQYGLLKLSQAEYDALSVKDTNTLYIIVG